MRHQRHRSRVTIRPQVQASDTCAGSLVPREGVTLHRMLPTPLADGEGDPAGPPVDRALTDAQAPRLQLIRTVWLPRWCFLYRNAGSGEDRSQRTHLSAEKDERPQAMDQTRD